jgi:hypothetical protein
MKAEVSMEGVRRDSVVRSLYIFLNLPRFWRMIAAPILLYFAAFALLTFPLVLQFNKAFLTDNEDGYQMVWDLWWVRQAILRLHQSPFVTPWLHFPFGTSLWLHTLMPFNGLLSIPLRVMFTEVQAFNIIVLLAFVGSGVTAFWLCRTATHSYWPSLAGGFAFECCSYRWAHYFGHLNLISTEALPLFLLCLLRLTRRPRILTAIGAAIAMCVSLLCDQYQFLYCVLAGAVVAAWWLLSGRASRALTRSHFIALGGFLLASVVSCGPFVWGMVRESARPPLRMHDPDLYSADLLAPWVPDWTWVDSRWTRPLWSPGTHFFFEKSVCLGPAVVIAAMFAFFPRRRAPRLFLGSTALFAALGISFMLLSFGPSWRIWVIPITDYTPYRALGFVLPYLRLAGCTARMMIVTQLSVSVLAAAGLSRLAKLSRVPRMVLGFVFAILLVFESRPRALLSCPPDVPRWVEVLRDAPGSGAVVDFVGDDRSIGLYYQTVHHRAVAMGDIFRISIATYNRTAALLAAADRGQYDQMSHWGFGYIVKASADPPLPLPLYYSDRAVRIYRLFRG